MHFSEYKNIYDNEEKHFYYVGTRIIIFSIVKKYLKELLGRGRLKILDAGCGTGYFSKKTEELGAVVGVDIKPEAIYYARKRGVKTVKASINNLPFKDSVFDLIFSIDVLYHQSVKDEKALNEFNRVLKKNGFLVLKLPAYDFLRGAHDLVVMTKRRYTISVAIRQLENAGFLVVRSTYIASFLLFPAIIKRTLGGNSGKGYLQSDVFMPWPVINFLLIFLFKIENLLLNFFNFPFGLSLVIVARKMKC